MATKIDTDTSTDDSAHRSDAEGAQDAFDTSFEGNGEAPPPAASASVKPPAPAASPAAGPAPAPAPKAGGEAPPADAPLDPYAGLSKEARAQLAEVPTLKHAFDSLNGRYVALEKQLQQLLKAAPASAPSAAPAPQSTAAKRAKREAIRGELAEVAEAFDELEEAMRAERAAAAAPAPAGVAADEDEGEPASFKTLTAVDPDWQDKLRSTEFALWLTQQPPAYANNVRTTGEAAVISSALAKFDSFSGQVRAQNEARDADKQRVESERTNRVANAASSRRGSARPPPTSAENDVEAEFERAFEKAG